MLGLMSKEEFDYCSAVVQELRYKIHACNTDIHLIEQKLNDQLDPPSPYNYQLNVSLKEYIISERQWPVNLIKDIREVLVEPPSMESRIVGYTLPFLSFSYF